MIDSLATLTISLLKLVQSSEVHMLFSLCLIIFLRAGMQLHRFLFLIHSRILTCALCSIS